MIELGIGPTILRAAGWLIWLVFIAAMGLALWIGKTWRRKAAYAVLVMCVFSLPIWPGLFEQYQFRQRYKAAEIMFNERCKIAGEKIYKTVDGVDGVLLHKLRPAYENRFGTDPMHPGAAMILEYGDDAYIASFLRYANHDGNAGRLELWDWPTATPGYQYVEVVNAQDGRRYRYTSVFSPANLPRNKTVSPVQLTRVAANGEPPRYAVTFEDVIDPAERRNWIAGTVLRVIDTQTGELLGEQTRFLFDRGLGSVSGARNPWSWTAGYTPGCPEQTPIRGGTRAFVAKVLKPTDRG